MCYVSCNGMDLTTIPAVHLQIHVKELDISCNVISQIKLTDLSNILSLRALNLSSNNISSIDDGPFQELIHLRELYMSSNRLKHVTKGCLRGLVSLSVLRFDGNEIEQIDPSAFVSLQNLTHVNLAKNRLTRMESVKTILDLPNLFELIIEYNYITSFVSHNLSSKPLQLQRLDLFLNPLNTFQITNNVLPHLRFLSISRGYVGPLQWNIRLTVRHSQITKFNYTTHVLPTLSQLDFSNNNINQVTCSDFSNLTLLKRLDLHRNQIYNLSNCTFQNLQNLQVLKLGLNNLIDVRHIFNDYLPKLNILDLHSNKISTLLEGTFKGLCALQHLSIYDNQINSISENAFEGLHNLKELVLTGNHLNQNTFTSPDIFKGLESLEELNLNDNYITFDRRFKFPPFAMLKSLKKLFVADQRRGMTNLPCNLLEGLSSLTSFHGSNLNIQYVCPETFSYTPKLQYLDLSNNAFMMDNSLSSRVFHPILALSELNLEQSLLTSLNFVIDANLSQLTKLQIKNNQLQVINQTIIEFLPNLRNVDIRNNKFICDCSNEWLLHWANTSAQTQVLYFNQYQCSYPPAAQGQYLEDFKTSSCTLDLEFIYFVGSSSLVIATLLVSFTYDFVRFQLVYAYYLLLAYLYDSKRQRRQRQHGLLYDAFVSYNSQDELWVLQELLPHLETEQGWRLCLHHRDFEPGKPIIDNIVDGIYSSRKTICVVTRNYLRSEWCSKEIQVASFRLFDENNDVLILVLLEDIPAQQLSPYHRMRKLVKKQTYLCWPKHGEDKRIFWEKLRMAMSANTEDNHIL
ncbi:toll-like receptor 13 [Engraulis encrasicolus]|uniref:toll-like receptor 13 n=1 Tax=Engraulis encrasicolus TaxID=184585 RepID=UPI002FD37F87